MKWRLLKSEFEETTPERVLALTANVAIWLLIATVWFAVVGAVVLMVIAVGQVLS